MIKIILLLALVFFAGYVFGLYWHIKTAHKIMNEALDVVFK